MGLVEIDGSQGEGGGQILRTALSLSSCTGTPIRIKNIRSGRKKPGLMRQHLACINAAAKVCSARVEGASLGSTEILYEPRRLSAGEFHFAIGTAGSSTLVFQTVLPMVLLAGEHSKITLEGGTHNPMAPTYDFLRLSFLPVLAKMGVDYHTSIERYGFYPAGGGRWSIELRPPSRLKKLNLESAGEFIGGEAVCIGAGRLPGHVLQREKRKLKKLLGWDDKKIMIKRVPSHGTGNVVSVRGAYRHVCEVIDGIGLPGIRAEAVASDAAGQFLDYQRTGAPVGHHLADQLLLPMAIAEGGSYITGEPSEHTRTNIAVIRQMTDVDIRCDKIDGEKWRISVSR